MKKILLFTIVIALEGCAPTYTLHGQSYDSKEKLYQAAEVQSMQVVETIQPLQKTVTRKKLIFALPSLAAMNDVEIKAFIKANGRDPTELQRQMGSDLNAANLRTVKGGYFAIIKRNIYPAVQFVELDSGTSAIAASADSDALYYAFPAPSSGQWYYTSLKNGKQIFTFDRSSSTDAGRLQAFVEAVEVQAIRE